MTLSLDIDLADQGQNQSSLDLYSADVPFIVELDAFLRGFPGLSDYYLPISKIGEGTFSTVYKAIDIRNDFYDNSAWTEASVQDNAQSLAELDILAHYIYHPELYKDVTEVPLEHTLRWRSCMKDYLDRQGYLDYKEAHWRQRKVPFYVALKRINMTSSPDRILDEIAFIKTLDGSSEVVPVVTAMRHEDQVIVVMPYFQHDDFREYLGQMTIDDIRCYMYSLFRAIRHVHSKSIIHRDLKPSNFLYSVVYKRGLLVDFGLAQRYTDVNEEPLDAKNIKRVSSASAASQNHHHLRMPIKPVQPGYYLSDNRPAIKASRAGTRGFRAPEVLFKYPAQTISIDIWSIGVIFLTLLTRQYPFFNSPDDLEAIVEVACIFGTKAMTAAATLYNRTWSCNVPTCPTAAIPFDKLVAQFNPSLADQVPIEAYDLLSKCLCLNANERISAAEAVEHSFFKSLSAEH